MTKSREQNSQIPGEKPNLLEKLVATLVVKFNELIESTHRRIFETLSVTKQIDILLEIDMIQYFIRNNFLNIKAIYTDKKKNFLLNMLNHIFWICGKFCR